MNKLWITLEILPSASDSWLTQRVGVLGVWALLVCSKLQGLARAHDGVHGKGLALETVQLMVVRGSGVNFFGFEFSAGSGWCGWG